MTCKICGKKIMTAVDDLCFECFKAVPDLYKINFVKSIGEYFASQNLSDGELGKRFAQIILNNIASCTIELKVGFFEEFLTNIDMSYEKAFKERSCDES